VRATPITVQPLSAKLSAAARPIPLDAPVIRIDFVIASS
jgi:hypothetical protein